MKGKVKKMRFLLRNRIIIVIACATICVISNNTGAQLVVTANSLTPAQLVQNILVGTGVTVSNITFNSPTSALNIGYFSNGANTNLGLDSGIIMASGSVMNAIGPNTQTGAGNATNTGGDAQLAALIPGFTIYDAAVLEFDFIPLSDTIKFRYVFGSEEYPEYVNSSYNDVFGFFISGPNPLGGMYSNQNIALIPGTNLPVCIDNVNNVTPSYTQYYINNTGGLTIQYDGFTTVLTAWVKVFPCIPYHLKIAISDAGDHILDSGVFLEANSFSSPIVGLSTTYSSPNIDTLAVEGCNDAIVSFKLPFVTTTGYVVSYSIGGTAINGVDYVNIPDSVSVPVGSDSTGLVISPFLDSLIEGTENIILIVQTSPCGHDTLEIFIKDNSPVTCMVSPDTMICGGFATLSVADSGGIQPYSYSWSNGDTLQTILVSPTIPTKYYVTVTDKCGSVAIDSVDVTIGGGDFADAGSDTTICEGATVILTASVGNHYYWNTGDTTQSISVSPITHTTYSVTITKDCDDEDTVKVFVNPLPNITASVSDTVICPGDSTMLDASGADTYLWSANPGDASLVGQQAYNNPLVSPYSTTTYKVIGTDTNLCSNTDSVSVTIYPLPTASFIARPNPVSEFNPEVTFNDNSSGNPVKWLWDLGDGTSENIPSFRHIYGDTGIFVVSLYVTNVYGCDDSTSKEIWVRPDFTLWVPNAFTPNSDDINDEFKVIGVAIKKFEMRIFDRWNHVVFESTNIDEAWDGTYLGRKVPVGNYAIHILYTDSYGLRHNKYCQVTVIR